MKVYIGFAKPTISFPIFGWIIQWVERRPYDHVYIRMQEPTGEYMIFQASKAMVNLYNKDIFLESNSSVKEYEIEITTAQYAALWEFVKNSLGIPYSLKEDFGILLMKIFKIKQPFVSGYSSEFCSKLAAQVCMMFGIALSDDPGSIDPSGLDAILEAAKLPCTNNPDI